MSVTPSADLAGVLPVVISGGRPSLDQRVTHRLLPTLHGVTADPVWLVRADRAADYDRDRHEIVTFDPGEAEEYARAHWFSPDPFVPGGFLGGFTEREWACRTAAERGCWAVLQLDDNLDQLRLFTGYGTTRHVAMEQGGLGLYADILAAVTLSTNSRMTGANLSAVNPRVEAGRFARAGFPYSLFLERVDRPDREPYFGPFEDDILHAYQYGSRPDEATASVVIPIHYLKEHVRSAATGMRAHYGSQRAAGLVMVAPEMATAVIKRKHSNGRGDARIFHQMNRGAIRTPLVVRDRALFDSARDRCAELRELIKPRLHESSAARIGKHAGRAEKAGRLRAHVAG